MESKLAALLKRAFLEREFYLRVDGRVRYLRLGSRIQVVAASLLLVAGLWVVYASAQAVLHRTIVEAKDREIEQTRMAYLELLEQVNGYHGQYARVIESLENNQAFLLNMMEDERAGLFDKEDIRRRIARSKVARQEVAAARAEIEELLRAAEKDREAQSQVGRKIRDQIAQIKALLDVTEAQRVQVRQARDHLAAQLSLVQSQLSASETSKRGLEATVRQLGQELTKTKADRTQLSAAQLALSAQVGRLQVNLMTSREREAGLESQVSAMEGSLDDAVALGSQLARERDDLLGRVTGLEARLVELQSAQETVMVRLTSQTQQGIENLEAAISSAGLDPDELLARFEAPMTAQGGPFLPVESAGVELAELAPDLPDELSIESLDHRMNRWQALRELMRALPFAAPVDNYRLTSAFGVRKDPLNGRQARHNGLDFAAPVGSEVHATAPGKVVFAGWYGRYGRMVEIDHGFGIHTRVAHLRKIYVGVGQSVKFRDKLGVQGTSGRSSGPHVHYEIRVDGRPVDPRNFLKAGRDVFKG